MRYAPGPKKHTNLPPAVARLLQRAVRALSLNQPASAEQALKEALTLAPEHAEAHRLMGIAALRAGHSQKAIESLRSALAKCPGDARITMTLGSVLLETGAIEQGLTHLKHACELAPDTAIAWSNYGIALVYKEKMALARDAFERAIAIDPAFIKARTKLSEVLVSLGDKPAAVEVLRGTLKLQPDCVDAWVALSNLKTEPLGSEDVSQLKSLLGQAGMPDESRIPLTFALAKALEDQSDYAAAFEFVGKANALKRRHVYWSRAEESDRVDAIAQAFARPAPEPLDAKLGEEVIFVVCVPRSGSTLTEQILASHSQVQGCDELHVLHEVLEEESRRRGTAFPHWVPMATAADWQRLGMAYLDQTRKFRDQHPRFTDKSPSNWAYVGAALAMLPGARIVNSRRDPLETCFACYRQLFVRECHFTYDLDDMVDYYTGYHRLSALWQQRFPQRYFDNHYESLQQDMEGQIRRLLAFCELSFEPACLKFHQNRRTVLTLSSAQVREPLRQDTARSLRYREKLDPLRDKLRAAGLGSTT
ncbi:MAG: sulfotransferase [Rhodanobacteraceae bacterium]